MSSIVPVLPRLPRACARVVLALLAFAVLAGLSACGTVSKAECQTGDWTGIGQRDGRNGEPEDLFDKHVQSCARYELGADRDAWLRGRSQGLVEYCTPLSGFANGSAGRTYHGVCTGPRGADFLDAYGFGRDVFVAREAARRAREESERIEDRLSSIESEIFDLRSKAAGLEGPDRDRLRDRIRDLEDLRFDLVSDRFGADRDARMAEAYAEEVTARARQDFVRRYGFAPG
jgi:hypothetical protein